MAQYVQNGLMRARSVPNREIACQKIQNIVRKTLKMLLACFEPHVLIEGR